MYGGVPPLNVSESDEGCPVSRAGGFAVGVPTVSAALTVTVTAVEVTIWGVVLLSVTWSSNDHCPVVPSAPVVAGGAVGEVHCAEVPRLVKLVAPGGFSRYWQV